MFLRETLMKHFVSMALWLALTGLVSCNPFAPAYDPNGLSGGNLLGDPSTIDGYFRLFQNAYELRDTTLYGRLFTQDFTFAYPDPDAPTQEVQWDRSTELNTAYRLFQSVLNINLDWTWYTQIDSSQGNEALVIRNFNLTIQQDESNTFSGTGRARLRLRRIAPGEPWRAFFWFDESDF
jgi:hypothetical protein